MKPLADDRDDAYIPTPPQKFRKRPVVVEAVQLRWDTWSQMCEFVGVGSLEDGVPTGGYAIPGTHEFANQGSPPTSEHVLALAIPTLEGLMIGHENDWIIKGVQGEFYPCKPDIFDATYEQVTP